MSTIFALSNLTFDYIDVILVERNHVKTPLRDRLILVFGLLDNTAQLLVPVNNNFGKFLYLDAIKH